MSRRDPYPPSFDKSQYILLLVLMALLFVTTWLMGPGIDAELSRSERIGAAYSSGNLQQIAAVERECER